MECRRSDAVDFGKGCFLGQETIVRIRDRGHVNWRLARLEVEGEPASGDAVESEARHGAKAGHVTSVGVSRDGHTRVLAILHAGIAVGAQITVRGHGAAHPARVEADFF